MNDDTADMDKDEEMQRLEGRIDELENAVLRMLPSRRDVLKMGGAAAVGAAAFSGSASAGGQQKGTIGDSDNLVDIEAEDITIADTLNTASISNAVAGDALFSDGNGNLQFGATGGGGIVLESGDSISVRVVDKSNVDQQFVTLYNGSAKDVLGGIVTCQNLTDFLYEFADGSTIRKNGSGTSYTFDNTSRSRDAGGENQEIDFLPPAKDVVKIEVGANQFDGSLLGAEVILKD